MFFMNGKIDWEIERSISTTTTITTTAPSTYPPAHVSPPPLRQHYPFNLLCFLCRTIELFSSHSPLWLFFPPSTYLFTHGAARSREGYLTPSWPPAVDLKHPCKQMVDFSPSHPLWFGFRRKGNGWRPDPIWLLYMRWWWSVVMILLITWWHRSGGERCERRGVSLGGRLVLMPLSRTTMW